MESMQASSHIDTASMYTGFTFIFVRYMYSANLKLASSQHLKYDKTITDQLIKLILTIHPHKTPPWLHYITMC